MALDTDGVPLTMANYTNSTELLLPGGYDVDLEVEDTNWILTSSFIIFTMQTGFGMLESGCVSVKNEVNIMMKNVVDIVLGGLTYWIFGYGLSFGKSPWSTPVMAIGGFFIDPSVGDHLMGPIFAAFLFQLSFATTATTIVSGAMAERCDFKAYCLFSLLNTIVYCVPAGWVWGEHGFLYNMGVVDIAGSGPVHLIGGSAAFASAWMLGPRLGRYSKGRAPLPPGTPVNAVLGLFVLWWGWLAFNSGSTYGVSGAKWQYAARAAVITMVGSFGGGCFGLIYSLIRFGGKLDLMDLINSVLGALVSVTAGCFLYHSWEALLIGAVGGVIACLTMPLVDRMGVDDPVGATSVHGFCGIWGVIAVGLFADNPIPLETTNGRSGLFKGGGWYLLGVQSLAALCLTVWGVLSTALLLWIVSCFRRIRMTAKEELLGADLTEHMIRHPQEDITITLKILGPYMDVTDVIDTIPIGSNPGHKVYMQHHYPPKADAFIPHMENNFLLGELQHTSSGTRDQKHDFFDANNTKFPTKLNTSDIERFTFSSAIDDGKFWPKNRTYNDGNESGIIDATKRDFIEYNGDTFRILKLPRIRFQRDRSVKNNSGDGSVAEKKIGGDEATSEDNASGRNFLKDFHKNKIAAGDSFKTEWLD